MGGLGSLTFGAVLYEWRWHLPFAVDNIRRHLKRSHRTSPDKPVRHDFRVPNPQPHAELERIIVRHWKKTQECAIRAPPNPHRLAGLKRDTESESVACGGEARSGDAGLAETLEGGCRGGDGSSGRPVRLVYFYSAEAKNHSKDTIVVADLLTQRRCVLMTR